MTRKERSKANRAAWKAKRAAEGHAPPRARAGEKARAATASVEDHEALREAIDPADMTPMEVARFAVHETWRAYKACKGDTAKEKLWGAHQRAQKQLGEEKAKEKAAADRDLTKLDPEEQGELLVKSLSRLPPGLRLRIAEELAMLAGPLHEVEGDAEQAKGG